MILKNKISALLALFVLFLISPYVAQAADDKFLAQAVENTFKIKYGSPTNSKNLEAMQKVALATDYYECLGVKATASDDEIRLAFRHLSFLMHPDKSHSISQAPNFSKIVEGAFQKISEAHDTLADEERRSDYDHGLVKQSSSYRLVYNAPAKKPALTDTPSDETTETSGASWSSGQRSQHQGYYYGSRPGPGYYPDQGFTDEVHEVAQRAAKLKSDFNVVNDFLELLRSAKTQTQMSIVHQRLSQVVMARINYYRLTKDVFSFFNTAFKITLHHDNQAEPPQEDIEMIKIAILFMIEHQSPEAYKLLLEQVGRFNAEGVGVTIPFGTTHKLILAALNEMENRNPEYKKIRESSYAVMTGFCKGAFERFFN